MLGDHTAAMPAGTAFGAWLRSLGGVLPPYPVNRYRRMVTTNLVGSHPVRFMGQSTGLACVMATIMKDLDAYPVTRAPRGRRTITSLLAGRKFHIPRHILDSASQQILDWEGSIKRRLRRQIPMPFCRSRSGQTEISAPS